MKVSDFPNQAPTDGTKVPVVGEKHFTVEQLIALLDQRYVQTQPPQAVSGAGATTLIKAQMGAGGDQTGGSIVIESGNGGPEHGQVGDITIRADGGSGGGGNVVIQCGNGNSVGDIRLGLRGLPACIMISPNNRPIILGSDQVWYELDVDNNGFVKGTAIN